MKKVIQISDIHLKGDYNGQFPVQENLDRTLQHVKNVIQPDNDSIILLTGDLADNGSVEDYDGLLGQISEMFPETPIALTPGNHDNRRALARSYNSYVMGSGGALCNIDEKMRVVGNIEVPGSSLSVIDVCPNTIIAVVDTGEQSFCYEGLMHLLPYLHGKDRPTFKNCEVTNVILATHYPLISVPHVFMNDASRTLHIHSFRNTMRVLTDEFKVETVWCGHYHHYCERRMEGIKQVICPSTQMQLDPYSSECSPSGKFPGYILHEFDTFGCSEDTVFFLNDKEIEK